jgi:hypothetical protein
MIAPFLRTSQARGWHGKVAQRSHRDTERTEGEMGREFG